jgi:Cu(I)/Ag(I) efflux system membrane protein CusA/SilA
MERARARLMVVAPLTLAIIALLLYLNFRSVGEVLILLGTLPFTLVGSLWLLYWEDFNFSIAVGVGFIALAGVAVETGVIMLLYLNQAYRALQHDQPHFDRSRLRQAVQEGAGLRVRPVTMTAVATIAGLLPILYGSGTGSEVMSRIAAPMVGGMVTAVLLTMLVLPAIYLLWRGRKLG